MEAKKLLVMPWWAWTIVALLWFEAENEHQLRRIYHRFKGWLV
jgi:hypothetical protein